MNSVAQTKWYGDRQGFSLLAWQNPVDEAMEPIGLLAKLNRETSATKSLRVPDNLLNRLR